MTEFEYLFLKCQALAEAHGALKANHAHELRQLREHWSADVDEMEAEVSGLKAELDKHKVNGDESDRVLIRLTAERDRLKQDVEELLQEVERFKAQLPSPVDTEPKPATMD